MVTFHQSTNREDKFEDTKLLASQGHAYFISKRERKEKCID
jgi:hypothetical protein